MERKNIVNMVKKHRLALLLKLIYLVASLEQSNIVSKAYIPASSFLCEFHNFKKII